MPWGALAFLGGLAGLGSETAVLKLIEHTVGRMPLAGPAVVAGFILCGGIGARLASRVARPWWPEAASAALQLALVFGVVPMMRASSAALARLAPVIGLEAASIALGLLISAPFALLVGLTLPALIEASGSTARTYGLHALGALAGVVAIEAAAYPAFGLPGCAIVLAVAHAVTAVGLARRAPSLPTVARSPGSPRLLWIGVGTGAIQGAWLLYAQLLERPFYFVAPAVVGSMLAGLHLGSRAFSRLGWSLDRALLGVLIGGAVSLGLGAMRARGAMPEEPLWAAIEIALLVLPVATPIGAVVPAFLGRAASDRARAGSALWAVSWGNALGLTAVTALTSAWLPAPVTVAVGLALVLTAMRGRAAWGGIAAVALAGLAAAATTDAALIARTAELEPEDVAIDRLFRAPGEVSAIFRAERRRRLYQTGYQPLDLDALSESLIGAVGAAYAPRRDRALVIGVGSGRSAGAVASVFRAVDAIDLGATVEPLCRALSADNLRLLDRPGVKLHRMDGLLAPVAMEGGYDLIVQTVDPGYHALAAKLYTVEHLERLSALLAPDGVLVFWSDATLSARANQVLVNTGRAVFPHQKLFSAMGGLTRGLGVTYYFLIHARVPFEYRPHALRYAFGDDSQVRALPLFGGWPPGQLRGAPPVSLDLEPPLPPPEEPDRYRLIRGRFDPTEAVHRATRPERSILFGGRYQGELVIFGDRDG